MRPEELCARRDAVTVLDVRNDDELAVAHIGGDVVHIPLSQLEQRWHELPTDKPVVALCHHGVRSQKAALFLQSVGLTAHSMAGGIDAWSLVVDRSVPRY